MKLSKIELKYLAPMVLFNGYLKWKNGDMNCYFDGFKDSPQRHGTSLKSLCEKGFIECSHHFAGVYHYTHTKAARALICKAHGCERGVIVSYDDDDYPTKHGKCDVCDGVGLVNNAT